MVDTEILLFKKAILGQKIKLDDLHISALPYGVHLVLVLKKIADTSLSGGAGKEEICEF